MGKYIKYFKTAAEFAEYYNFAEWAPGPDEGDDSTFVAFVAENGTVYYYTSDMSELISVLRILRLTQQLIL